MNFIILDIIINFFFFFFFFYRNFFEKSSIRCIFSNSKWYLNCENLKLNAQIFNANKNLPIHARDGYICKINISLPIKSFFLGINNDINDIEIYQSKKLISIQLLIQSLNSLITPILITNILI